MNRAEVDRLFDHHPPDEAAALVHEGVRDAFKILAITLSNLPSSRERSLCMTKLEEASFWAHAAVARPPA